MLDGRPWPGIATRMGGVPSPEACGPAQIPAERVTHGPDFRWQVVAELLGDSFAAPQQHQELARGGCG